MSKTVLDLNLASDQELERITGLSKESAKKIVDYRKLNGPFADWEDLKQVPGYTNQMAETLRRHSVTIGGKAAA
jgi:competence ComEA-like helix-hairpin-helix protein